ncbi:cytidylate kinase [Arboricoccus pini]|uniref:Cytidylate kinase n=1 Tax=Arboricoccus pini TaxID=1963835 RepID=A0A212R6W5_9PROT|nr:(d)CMP kinase [Arboricoccus pini]SNB67897.1 cytidylate kinase [Arboricoccus pini]
MSLDPARAADPLVIAVDGPAASGKSTIAKALAGRFGLAFLDTGLLYRAVGRKLLDCGLDPADAEAALKAAETLQASDVDEAKLTGDETGQAGSKVAAVPSVRAVLLPFQRNVARSAPGAVLAGRDVGTVICPDAAVKLFITASVEERANRRFAELHQRGANPIRAQVLEDMIERDRRDTSRSVAPLRVADDAHVLDTTQLSLDATLAAAAELVRLSLVRAGRRDEAASG